MSLASCSVTGVGDRAADKCGRKGGTSTIEAINYPGPLWSCQVQSASAGRETEGEAEQEAEEAVWVRGGSGGENGWDSASGSILAASVGLGRSSTLPRLLVCLLPDPGSWGKVQKYAHVHERSLPSPFRGIIRVQVFFKGGSILWQSEWIELAGSCCG